MTAPSAVAKLRTLFERRFAPPPSELRKGCRDDAQREAALDELVREGFIEKHGARFYRAGAPRPDPVAARLRALFETKPHPTAAQLRSKCGDDAERERVLNQLVREQFIEKDGEGFYRAGAPRPDPIADRVRALFRRAPRPTPSALLKSASNDEAILEGTLDRLERQGVIRKVQAHWYRADVASESAVQSLIEQKLKSARLLFPLEALRKAAICEPFVVSALEGLIESGRVIRWEISGKNDFVYGHADFCGTVRGEATPGLPGERIEAAYRKVAAERKSEWAHLSSVADEAGVSIGTLHDWVRAEIIQKGRGSLAEGDFAHATEAQREAALYHRSHPRLLLKIG